MKDIALEAFQEARYAGEAGWHTISSIIVPYMATAGTFHVHSAIVRAECMVLAAQRKLKVRFAKHGRLEFKLA